MRVSIATAILMAFLPIATALPAGAETPGLLLPGKELLVTRTKSGNQRLKLQLNDAGIDATMPCEVDGELVLMAEGAGLRVDRFPLDAGRWESVEANAPEKGCRYRGGPVVAKALIKPGKSLKVVAKGSDLLPLAPDPRPFRVEFRHGDLRQCAEFGGDGTYKADRKLIAKNASAPAACLSDTTAHELIDITGGLGDWVVWLTLDLTPAEFDALTPPAGWIRNQSRGGDGVGADGRFLRSPGRDADGEFTRLELFGVSWLHSATVVRIDGTLDPDGLLRATTVEKHHQLTWRAGNSITVLTSPEGLRYALVSRDARRTSDTPTIPDGWTLEAIPLSEDLPILLPLRTTVIRTDNEDSFQGPLPADLAL